MLVATQDVFYPPNGTPSQTVNWEYWDAGGTKRTMATHGSPYYFGAAELDPEGSDVGVANPSGGQPNLSQSPGGWGYGSFGDPFGAFGCRVDGFDYPQAMCIQHLANGTGDFVQHHDQPGFLGHWIDVDDPNPPPFPPGTPPDAVRGGSVIAKFVPFPIWIPGFAGADIGGTTLTLPDEGGNNAIVKEDCVNALKGANQNLDAVKRAVDHMQELENAAQGLTVLTAPLLAAIAIRESGFQNQSEIGGGGGKGVFQITYGNPSQDVLDSVEKSARWVLEKLLYPAYNELPYGNSLSLLGALRNYNAGGGSERGRKLTTKILKEQDKAGSPYSPEAFSYGTSYPGWGKDGKKYEKGNYVKNVLDIAIHCFDYTPPEGIPNP